MGSVSADTDKRSLDLFEGFEAPPSNDGIVELTFKQSRHDGYPVWTENKAKLIGQYVRYFTFVTKHGTYIDGFAGPQVEHDDDDTWSAKRVLELEPRWLRRFILCDKSQSQVELLGKLVAKRRELGDTRKVEVYAGDFNDTIEKILVPGAIKETEATFCLLDQRTFECRWESVRKIAAYKKTGAKIEQFYFLAVGWLGRSMSALKDDEKLRAWWGRDDVDVPKSTRNTVELAKLFTHRYQTELGYASALAWPIYERADAGGGKVMYYMIHATDHEEAPKLMNRAYKGSTKAAQPMEHVQLGFEGDAFDINIGSRYSAEG